ncbi:MAG: DUF4258 domain-containing protein [Alicyclobacillus herbarius]|uniref:DUF4258 domain-containing protein n=1 Tax=Alicyclobacillus herbarius TaxID=122960 RepID=UPI0023565F59|nr:DUF4258 domain-containing protein [Alicyclobacillus herbarius]MCL6633341.1 DUF4258 domain-containing protein [Alicyclobacillus herbarius]
MANGNAYQKHWRLLKSVLLTHLEHDLVEFTDHASARMQERGVPEAVVKLAIRNGELVEMHEPHAYPYGENPYQNRDPVFTIVGHPEKWKSPMAIALAIANVHGEAHFSVVTVITDLRRSRHNR